MWYLHAEPLYNIYCGLCNQLQYLLNTCHCIHQSILIIKCFINILNTLVIKINKQEIQVVHGTSHKETPFITKEIYMHHVGGSLVTYCILTSRSKNPSITMWHMELNYLCINYTRLASAHVGCHVLSGNSWQIKPHPYLILMFLAKSGYGYGMEEWLWWAQGDLAWWWWGGKH